MTAGRWPGFIRRYVGIGNGRRYRTEHFWQGRFAVVAMDESHLVATFPM